MIGVSVLWVLKRNGFVQGQRELSRNKEAFVLSGCLLEFIATGP